MLIEKFEEIRAWQKARELNRIVYQMFRNNADFRFRDQIVSATVSISNNISEGFERKGSKEFIRFLYIAKGSCGEVRSMSYLAQDMQYITEEDFNVINSRATEISRMISGLVKHLSS